MLLYPKDGDHVAPLPLRRLTAAPVPFQLSQNDIFGGVDVERGTVVDPVHDDALAASQSFPIQGIRSCQEDVDLYRRLDVDDVERTTYGAPNVSRTRPMITATATGSGNAPGVIRSAVAVHAVDEIVSQPQSRERQQQFALACSGMA